MKKILFVVFTFIFILSGCAAREDQTALQHDDTPMTQKPGRTETVPGVSAEKTVKQEPVTTEPALPKDFDTTSKLSENGMYSISYRSIGGEIKVNRTHSWELTVRDKDGKPVNNARVMLSGEMPVNERGLPVHPVVSRAGFEGLYRVDNMRFDMPGWWAVTVNVMANDTPDRVSFNLNLP